MKNIYIIGNGFDLNHNLDTRYQSFGRYLSQNKPDIYDLLIEYYGLPDLRIINLSKKLLQKEVHNPWSKFEANLANFNYKQLLEDKSSLMANPESERFTDDDCFVFKREMESITIKLTTELIEIFKSFILQIDYPSLPDKNRIHFLPNSIFLNFNYTKTLEYYYNIASEQICYIHNKADNDGQVILGHGVEPDNFKEVEVKNLQPQNLSDDQLDHWISQHHSDYSHDLAEGEVLSYFVKAFKNTNDIISNNNSFFDRLYDVEKIYVLGHSISEIDIGYFMEIKNCVNVNTSWVVSYYPENQIDEKNSHLKALTDIGISPEQIKLIIIDDLIKSNNGIY